MGMDTILTHVDNQCANLLYIRIKRYHKQNIVMYDGYLQKWSNDIIVTLLSKLESYCMY